MSDGIPPAPPITVIPIPPPPPPPPPPPIPGNAVEKKFGGKKTNVKTKRLVWNKIPSVQITSAETIWSPKSNSENRLSVDIDTINELFAVRDTPAKIRSPSPRGRKSKSSFANDDNSGQKIGPITLLDTKQSMNLNIFLRQFKRPVHEVVSAIEGCDTSLLSAEKLRTIFKLLPEKDDLKKLEEYKEDVSQLDDADRFVLGITKVPSYKLRIECAILRDEYTPAVKEIEESFDTLQNAMTEIRNCVALPSILHLVLQAGNYLNQGASYGNAAGFRLHSLKSLTDTKANHPGITMMHYVAMELEKQDDLMMSWPEQLPSLSPACRISFSMVREDLAVLVKKIQTLKDCVKRDKDEDLKQKMSTFMEMADSSLRALLEKGRMVEKTSKDLALYLCEQPAQFSLEDCFSTVNEFRNKFIEAAKENARKEKLKQKRERNRNLSSHSFTTLSSATNLRVSDLEKSMDDIRSGARSKRRNTVEIPRRRPHSPKLGRPFSEPVKSSTRDSVVEENESQIDPQLNSRLDLKVKQVTLTKLEPIQRFESENAKELTLPQERDTPWGVKYVCTTESNTMQIDPKVTQSSGSRYISTETQNDNADVMSERTSRRRYRSLRSIDAHDESRERRDYLGSTSSLNNSEKINESSHDVQITPTETKTDLNMEYLSPRERFIRRRSDRKVRTDLGLAEDSYVTRTGEILPMSASRSRWESSKEAENENKRSRNDDIRERIRRYKEKNAMETTGIRTVSSASDIDNFTSAKSRPRPASDNGSVTRLSRIFETRSVSYSAGNENQRKSEIVTDKGQSLDLKLEDVTPDYDAASSVFSPVRIRTPTRYEKPSELFTLSENKKAQATNDISEHEDIANSVKATDRTVLSSSNNEIEIDNNVEKSNESVLQKQTLSDNLFVEKLNDLSSALTTPQNTDTEKETPTPNTQDQKQTESNALSVVKSNDLPSTLLTTQNTDTEKETVISNLQDPSKSIIVANNDELQEKNSSAELELHEKNYETETAAEPVLSEASPKEQVDIPASNKNKNALKSGVSEVLNHFNEFHDDVIKNNDVTIVDENIQAEDAFSLLAEKQLENVNEIEKNSSTNFENSTSNVDTVHLADAENTMAGLKEDLKRMNAKLKSRHSPVQSASNMLQSRKSTPFAKQNVQTRPARATSSTRNKPWEVQKISTLSKSNKVPTKTESRTRKVSENQKPTTKPSKSNESVKPPATSPTESTGTSDSTKRVSDTKRRDTQENRAKMTQGKAATPSKSNENTIQRTTAKGTRNTSTVRANTALRKESSIVASVSFRNRNSTMRNSTSSLHTIGQKPASNVGDTSTLPRSGKKATPRVVSSSSTLPRVGKSSTTTPANIKAQPQTNKRSSPEETVNAESNTLPRSGKHKSTRDTTSSASLRNNKPTASQSFRATSARPRSVASATESSVERKSSKLGKNLEKNNAVMAKSNNSGTERVAVGKPSPVRIEYLPHAKVLNSNHAVARVKSSDPNHKPEKHTTPVTTNTTPLSSKVKSARQQSEAKDQAKTPIASNENLVEKAKPPNVTNKKTKVLNLVKEAVVSRKSPSKPVTPSKSFVTSHTPTSTKHAKSPAAKNVIESKTSSAVGNESASEQEQKSIITPKSSSRSVENTRARTSSKKLETPPTHTPSNVNHKIKATSAFERLSTPSRRSASVTRNPAKDRTMQEAHQQKDSRKTKHEGGSQTEIKKNASPSTKLQKETSPDKREVNKDILSKKSPAKTNKKSESGLRSSSSSSLTSKPSSARGPPSSFKPLRDSISARSTSSLSSSSSSAAHRDVYMTKTARLRLSKMKSNKK